MNHSTQFDRFEDAETAALAIADVISRARRDVSIHTRNLEESIWEHPAILSTLRAFMSDLSPRTVRILVDEPSALNVGNTHFMALAQRLPSHIQFRQADPEHEQLDYECVMTDRDGIVKWDIGTRCRGEFSFDAPGRSQQLLVKFNRVWDRARSCSEFRALGI